MVKSQVYLGNAGYQELVVTTVLGYLIFGDFPEPWTWAGVVVIVGSGFYITIRERHVKGVRD